MDRIRKSFCMFILLILVWTAFTSARNLEEFITGTIVALILSIFLSNTYLDICHTLFNIKRIIFSVVYIFVLFWEIVKANIDVAWRILHPAMPIRPGIVEIKTSLKSDLAKVALANSITLTPGTFTLDILGDRLLVHWINVKTKNIDEASRMIAGRFERYIKLILE